MTRLFEMQNSVDSKRETVLRGVPAVPGRAVGPVVLYCNSEAGGRQETVALAGGDCAVEQSKVHEALAWAAAGLKQVAEDVRAGIGPDEAAIFEAQSLMAADPTLGERAAELVASSGLPAHEAILAAAGEQADMLASLDDPYLRERAADIRDVGERAARLALGESLESGLKSLLEDVATPCILLAEDLTASEAAGLNKDQVAGIGLSAGGPTSHVAILARALGVPLVCGLGALPSAPTLLVAENGSGEPGALLDGDSGLLVMQPAPERVAQYLAWRADREQAVARQTSLRDLPAQTPDGRRVLLAANAGSLEDALAAVSHGAEGIGLLRTEFLFLDHEPGEDEQVAAYSAIFEAQSGNDVVVRTMDLGGDKPPPYLDFGNEANPFLGWRGVRVALDLPDMLRTQVRALFRAGAGRTIKMMFPMVSTLEELLAARAIVESVQSELANENVPMPGAVEIGVMIEVPSAALMADALAPHVDFFSIGTNDLTQYTLAADRGAARVAHLYSPVQPAVLRLIATTVEAAHRVGKWVGMCGEAAGNPEWAALWLGLELDELSMSASSIPAVKEAIRRTRFDEAQRLAGLALQQPTLEEVHTILSTNQIS